MDSLNSFKSEMAVKILIKSSEISYFGHYQKYLIEIF